jgi:hypothetical protein
MTERPRRLHAVCLLEFMMMVCYLLGLVDAMLVDCGGSNEMRHGCFCLDD